MGNGIFNPKAGEYTGTEQSTEAHRNRGDIGDRSTNLIKLIGAERVSRRSFKYEGTYYITEDGEIYDKEYVETHKPQRTGISFYEVTDWLYNESKQMYEPTIRRIVIIKNTNIQLSLNL